MKILESETKCIYKNGFSTKKVLAECSGLSDIDFIMPKKHNLLLLYKNAKPLGVVVGKNNADSVIIPTLLKIELVDNINKFAVFNVKDGKIIYRGNSEITFTSTGFVTKKIVPVEETFDCKGKKISTKIKNEKDSFITIGELLDKIDVNNSVDY